MSDNEPAAPPLSAWRFGTRALQHRNYRLFFGGQSISLIGTFLTRTAVLWTVYVLVRQSRQQAEWILGVVGFAGQLPMFVLAPIAGALVDRWNRHRVLVVTQVALMAVSLTLALLSFSGWINVGWVMVLSVAQGLINSFDMPARQSFVVQMVDKREDLPNAIALNSSMIHAARLIGPLVAAGLIYAVGSSFCFLIDAVSFLAVIASLLAMRTTPPVRKLVHKHILTDLAEGMRYAFGFVPIRSLLLLLALVSLMGVPYQQLMPVYANRLVGHDGAPVSASALVAPAPNGPAVPKQVAIAMGALMAASGLGALSGAIFLASRRSVLGLGKVIGLAATLFGAGLIGFGLSPWLWLSLPMMLFTGFGMITQAASTNTVLQTIVEDDKRGRVMSIYGMSFMGVAPFGSLLAGWLAGPRVLGPVGTLLLAGSACIVGAGFYSLKLPAMRKLVAPIYVQRGILPQVADGLQAASDLTVPPER